MTKDQERLHAQAADAKLVHLNEQVLWPWFDLQIREKLLTLTQAYKNDGQVRTEDVAYIAAILDLRQHLESKARQGDRATGKLLESEA